MDEKTLKRYQALTTELDADLELKMSIHEYLLIDLVEQVYINKLNFEMDG